MTWTILSMIIAVACYACSQLIMHEKFRWGAKDYTFWGQRTYLRKYKFPLESYSGNWYYRFFKIKYKERFPLSATLLVAFTDGYHLSQAGFKLFLALSFAPITGWIWAGVIWLLWGITFTIFYRLFSL